MCNCEKDKFARIIESLQCGEQPKIDLEDTEGLLEVEPEKPIRGQRRNSGLVDEKYDIGSMLMVCGHYSDNSYYDKDLKNFRIFECTICKCTNIKLNISIIK